MERSIASVATAGTRASRDTDETRELGRRIGEAAVPGTVLALIGELGAGKTLLTKGVAAGLGVGGVVNSPTFILMNEHAGRLPLYHIDAYRLDEAEDASAAGLLDERQADGVTVVEWADRLRGVLPSERLEIRLETLPDEPMHRTLRWTARGTAHARLAAEALTVS
ncbi:MAG: tRNA (adenosine(37)-N6)-threonylcarbamoyltransferase complex ATPase subunit type 1 TsaE [Chloroflexi bacterium]|nr:tRNA (adenosine(37)-N6)-threonylcarbamoyltransferase complex ATPase subunit type 1 TsaE [Chloroflexota bacterium]